jgi:hypothetical protein
MRNNFKWIVSMFAFIILLSAIAFGQNTKGNITGTVKDQNGAIVPNATVKVEGTNIGFSKTYTTDDNGIYDAREIPVGNYRLTVTGTNLSAPAKNVIVTIGNTLTEDFTLSASGATASVDVLAGDSATTIDTTEAKAQTNITAAQIELLPKGTSFSSLLRTAASVRPNEPLSGQFQINGSSGAENSFIIDGQETSNFRTGALNGNNDIPFTSVQEVQIKSSGFEAEFGGATGGVVNVVTKSGSNDFHGEFGTAFQPKKLEAGPRPVLRSAFTGNPATVGGIGTTGAAAGQYVEYLGQQRDGGVHFFPTASLGGKLIKDKLWFYGIYSPQKFENERTTSFFTGNPGNGAGRVLIGPANFATSLPAYIRNTSPIQTSRTQVTNEYAFLRLDATPSDKLRLTGSYTWNPIVQKGILQGGTTVIGNPAFAQFGGAVGDLSGDDLARRQGGRQNANNIRAEGVWTPTSKSIVGLRFSRGFLNEKLNSYFIPNAPRIRCISGVATAGAGLAPAAQCTNGFQTSTNNFQVIKDVSTRSTIDADYSYLLNNFAGRHDIKAGYTYSKITNDVQNGYRNNGIIMLCYSTTVAGNNLNSLCNGFGPPVPITVQSVPPVGQTQIGIGFMQRFGTTGKASNTANILYFQDKWQVNSRLTLTLGLRAEKEDLPAFNIGGIGGASGTPISFGFKDKMGPRLGASYALTSDGKTKVAAFYGWFFDRLKFELPRGSFGGDFFRRDIFPIFSGTAAYTNYTPATIIGSFPDPLGGTCPITQSAAYLTRCNLDFRTQSNVAGQGGGVDPNLKAYRQDEFTVEVQRELMRNSVFSARYINRKLAHAIEDAGYISANGSEVYIIGNPGEGFHDSLVKSFGYSKTLKPERKYNALQLEYNSRYWSKFSFGVDYTYSRLFGNYSGLASSDENGRLSPGVTRYFDLPWVGFTAAGTPDNGRLATDRPHVFKYRGTYSMDWWGSKTNSTDFTVFGFAESGIPITSFVDVFGIPIPLTKRGDQGRTPKYTQTDLSITHKYKFGSDGKYGVAFDVNVLNLFNQAAVLNVDNNIFNPSTYELSTCSIVASCEYPAAVNVLTSTGVLSQITNETRLTTGPADTGGCDVYWNGAPSAGLVNNNFCKNPSFKLANAFQGQRVVRFGFRFIF